MALSVYAGRLKPGDTLDDLFRAIRRHMALADALKHLWMLYRGLHLHIVLALPDFLPFEADANGELIVRTREGRRVDPTKVLVRKPRMLEAAPWPLAEMAAFDAAEAHEKALQKAATEVMIDDVEESSKPAPAKPAPAHEPPKVVAPSKAEALRKWVHDICAEHNRAITDAGLTRWLLDRHAEEFGARKLAKDLDTLRRDLDRVLIALGKPPRKRRQAR